MLGIQLCSWGKRCHAFRYWILCHILSVENIPIDPRTVHLPVIQPVATKISEYRNARCAPRCGFSDVHPGTPQSASHYHLAVEVTAHAQASSMSDECALCPTPARRLWGRYLW